ncbi:hypothetical protein D3C85_1084500 [compost metagenome]
MNPALAHHQAGHVATPDLIDCSRFEVALEPIGRDKRFHSFGSEWVRLALFTDNVGLPHQRSDKASSDRDVLGLQALADHSGTHGFAAFAVQFNHFELELFAPDPRLGSPLKPLVKAAALHIENTTHDGRRERLS